MKKFSRKILFFLFLTIVMYQGFTAIGYGQAHVHIVFAQTNPLAVGEQMNVNIRIVGGQDVSGYELSLGFDPTALRYVTSANSDYLPAGVFVIPPIVFSGSVHIGATSIAGAASDIEGTLATLTFEVLAAKDSTIQLMDVILSNSAAMPLAVTTGNGQIIATQLPEIGDVNGDGKVNILDLTLVASNFITTVPINPRLDVNKDGNVNILDLVLIAQHLDAVRVNKVKPEVGVIPVNPEKPVVASRLPIDFAAEKAEIQAVFSAFYEAFNNEDIKGIQGTFDTSSIKFGTVFAGNEPVPIAIGWNNVKTNIQGLWIGIGTAGAKWGTTDQLSKFWIRYKGSKLEASALGLNCYKGAYPGETHLYFVKGRDGWIIQELDSITQNNLQIFGLDAKPRLSGLGEFFEFFDDDEDLAP